MVMIGARRPFPAAEIPQVGMSKAFQPLAIPAAAPRPTFFGQGGAGRAIAGNLGDFLLQLASMQPIYAPAKKEQSEFERGEQLYKRRRADQLTDDERNFGQQVQLLDYKRLHPDDQLTQNMVAAGIDPTSDAGRQYYRANVERLTAPPMMSAQGFDEQGNPVLRFFPRAPAAAPATGGPAVGTIRNGYRFKGGNPADQSSWEPIGGPTQPASGGFP